jgi:flavin reductase (DIM6/NTAB) family NADH-FMN oxidoreductase RutF
VADREHARSEGLEPPSAPIDDVRAFHRCFATGVTIVTVDDAGTARGLAVNAFSSVSLDPPLVLVCVAGSSATHAHLSASDRFAVNILAHDQARVARAFARSGGDKFEGIPWTTGPHGSPILDGVSAHIEVLTERRIPAFTHTIFIGRVLGSAVHDRPPLVYLGGTFYNGAALEGALEADT